MSQTRLASKKKFKTPSTLLGFKISNESALHVAQVLLSQLQGHNTLKVVRKFEI